MRYTIGRLQFTSATAYREPYFQLPGKASEVLEGYYKALQPRFPVELKDLQSLGGTSFADVKLIIFGLGGRLRVEVTPAALVSEYREPTDLVALRDFAVLVESTLQARLPEIVLQERAIRTAGWLRIEEGPGAVEQLLRERGDAALRMAEGGFKDWKRDYTLEVHLNNQKGKRLALLLQQSAIPANGDLFVRCDYVQTDLGDGLGTMAEAFDQAFKEFEIVLGYVDLKPKVDQ